jgi:hypothetical protein
LVPQPFFCLLNFTVQVLPKTFSWPKLSFKLWGKFCQLKMMCFLNLSHMFIQLEIIIWAFNRKKDFVTSYTHTVHFQLIRLTYMITLCMFIYTVIIIQHVLTWDLNCILIFVLCHHVCVSYQFIWIFSHHLLT